LSVERTHRIAQRAAGVPKQSKSAFESVGEREASADGHSMMFLTTASASASTHTGDVDEMLSESILNNRVAILKQTKF